MSRERKIFKGNLVRGVNIPNIGFENFRVSSSGFDNLSRRLDIIKNFAVDQGERIAIEEGKEYAAENPISIQQYLDANPKEREKLVKGDKITSYGRSVRAAQISMLSTNIAIDADKKMQDFKIVAVSSDMSSDEFELGLNAIVKGYSDGLAGIDADAAVTVKAKLATAANTMYTSYLDKKIKDYNDNKKGIAMVYGQNKIKEIPDIIANGFKRNVPTADFQEVEPFDVDKHLDAMKSQHLAELIDSNVGSEYIKKWSNDWDTAVNKAKRDHIFGQFIPEIEPSAKKAMDLEREVSSGNFGGNKNLQAIFKSMSEEDQEKLKTDVVSWANGQRERKENDEKAIEVDLEKTKQTLIQKYNKAEELNQPELARDILAEAEALDVKLHNSLYERFRDDKEKGLFVDEERKDRLYVYLYQGVLTHDLIREARIEDGAIDFNTAKDLYSKLETRQTKAVSEADKILRAKIGIPQEGEITTSFQKNDLYAVYQDAMTKVLNYKQQNPGVSDQQIIEFAAGLVQENDIKKGKEKEKIKIITGLKDQNGTFQLDNRLWTQYFKKFYKKEFTNVSEEFFQDKEGIDRLIVELTEYNDLKDGEKYEGVDGREKFDTVLELKKEDIIDLIDKLKSLKQYYE